MCELRESPCIYSSLFTSSLASSCNNNAPFTLTIRSYEFHWRHPRYFTRVTCSFSNCIVSMKLSRRYDDSRLKNLNNGIGCNVHLSILYCISYTSCGCISKCAILKFNISIVNFHRKSTRRRIRREIFRLIPL